MEVMVIMKTEGKTLYLYYLEGCALVPDCLIIMDNRIRFTIIHVVFDDKLFINLALI